MRIGNLISINVRYLVNFAIITERKQETFTVSEGTTIQGLLQMLGEKYGQKWIKELCTDDTGQVKPHVLILVNGQSVDRLKDKLLTVLSGKDSIIFTFPVTGG